MNSSNETSPRPAFQTDLGTTPLPEMLVTINRYKAPGLLECRRGAEVKEIFVDRGHIVFATSNQVRDSLGDKLLAEKKITHEQYDESVRRLVSTGKRQGTILTEMKVLEPDDMARAVREQIELIIWSVFSWDSGEVIFTPGREKHREFVKVDIPIPEAVVRGVRQMPDAKALVAKLGTKTTILERAEVNYDELSLDADETQLLDAVDGKRTLVELINSSPLSASMNARILYAFFALQMIVPKASSKVKVTVRTDGDTYSSQ
jgi:hypothetical protein